MDEHCGLLMIGIAGRMPSPDERKFLRECGVGGVILFSRNYEGKSQLSGLTRALEDAAGRELLIAVDQEGGRVQRFGPPFTRIPPMAEIGKAGNAEALAGEIGNDVGEELRAVGINVNFAPVLDVATNPANPVIGDRAFSSDPMEVARLGVAYMRGLQSAGVAACGKHFPGHGDTSVDSHESLPVIRHGRQRFDTCEFIPFVKAIEAGVDSIMTAHVLATGLDPGEISSASAKVMAILRSEMHYDGVVFSDDLLMKGISDKYAPAESAWRVIAAGSDMAPICTDDLTVHRGAAEGLKRARDEGLLPDARIAEALGRIANLLSKIR